MEKDLFAPVAGCFLIVPEAFNDHVTIFPAVLRSILIFHVAPFCFGFSQLINPLLHS
jgi:hypothetical protein